MEGNQASAAAASMEVALDAVAGSDYNRTEEVKAFDETKSGVKGLIDAGLVEIPRIFIHPNENLKELSSNPSSMQLQIPVIDLEISGNGNRRRAVDEIRKASETWGFFQMVNHGIPQIVMSGLLEGVRRFHEQPREVKMEVYSRDHARPIRYYSNGDLHVSRAANWRDSIAFDFHDDQLDCEAIPIACREAVKKYIDFIFELRRKLSELLSEALGLRSNFLEKIECMKSEALVCHYYPPCPQPDLTLGTTKHSDPSFLTILLQDNTGGLQVLHQHHWIDVPPVQGALVTNLGDLMQLITNDKFKSVEHRVVARRSGTRASAACFFYPSIANKSRPYGPIKEFIGEDERPLYRETSANEYLGYYRSKGLDAARQKFTCHDGQEDKF